MNEVSVIVWLPLPLEAPRDEGENAKMDTDTNKKQKKAFVTGGLDKNKKEKGSRERTGSCLLWRRLGTNCHLNVRAV